MAKKQTNKDTEFLAALTVEKEKYDQIEEVDISSKMRTSFLDMWHKIMKLRTNEAMITVLDVFEANDTAYAIAEADGSQTLTEFLYENNGAVDWNTINTKLFPVLDAIDALHRQGLVHGAISPDTLFLCGNGQFKLWGFGINEIRQTEGKLSADIRPGYASIEQYGKSYALSAENR